MRPRSDHGRVLDAPQEFGKAFVPPPPAEKRSQSSDETEPEEDSPETAAERELELARERGYREGREQARDESAQALAASREQTAVALRDLATLRSSLTREHEAVLLGVVVEAASRVVRQRIDAADPVCERALREALDALPADGEVRVRVHPDDLAPLGESLSAEIESGRIELLADPRVSRGGTVVAGPIGRIDATIETAERAVREALSGDGESS